jgi:hypothetical protein
MMRTRGFVEALKKKGCTGGVNLRTFCRQYTASSQYLVDHALLEGYTQALWFLEGVPLEVRKKIVRKHAVELDVSRTMNF